MREGFVVLNHELAVVLIRIPYLDRLTHSRKIIRLAIVIFGIGVHVLQDICEHTS